MRWCWALLVPRVASPVAAAGHLYFASQRGAMAVLPPGGDLTPLVHPRLVSGEARVMAGRIAEARQSYDAAIALCRNEAERDHLAGRRGGLG